VICYEILTLYNKRPGIMIISMLFISIFLISIAERIHARMDSNYELITAAEIGDVVKVKESLSRGADINSKNNFGVR